MNIDVMYSKKTNEWSTPQDFFDKLDKEFLFTLDPCATTENAKCQKYFTMQGDLFSGSDLQSSILGGTV